MTSRVEEADQPGRRCGADLLAAKDVGLIPWVPLAEYDGPPDHLIRQCREGIDQHARPEERENLIAVTQVFTRLRYNDASLLAILGGRQIMIESPLIQEIVAEKTRQHIVRVLVARLGPVPQDIIDRLQGVTDEAQLDDLVEWAARCPDLEAFRSRLSP